MSEVIYGMEAHDVRARIRDLETENRVLRVEIERLRWLVEYYAKELEAERRRGAG